MQETTIDIDALRADPTELFKDSLLLLASVRKTLAGLVERLLEGDPQVLQEIVRKHAELETTLRRAMETEQRYDDWIRKHDGRLRAGEIDFDRARHEIGCRLARLRACGPADRIP